MWVHEYPDRHRVSEDAVAAAGAVPRALEILDDPDSWSNAFAQ